VIANTEAVRRSPNGAHTDMMHRRTLLNVKLTGEWLGRTVRIETNSSHLMRAAAKIGITPVTYSGQQIDHHWEIVVEQGGSASSDEPSTQAFRAGSLLMVEIGHRGWFAVDLETGDGAGFLEIYDSKVTLHNFLRSLTDTVRHELGRDFLVDANDE
jgi:hypothetical protein